MGSDSDLPRMAQVGPVLEAFGVPFQLEIASAHRTPERVHELATTAKARGVGVIIAGAGAAAHLAGAVAAQTTLPVIGVPLSGSAVQGLDALLATVQMPAGVPVATVAIDGVRNAALLAVSILALADPGLARRLEEYRRELAAAAAAKAHHLRELGPEGYLAESRSPGAGGAGR